MTADHLLDIEQFNADLWKVADELRANSGLASNEYFMPIMGILFLRQATNRYYEARTAIEADKAAGKIPDRPLVDADFRRRRAMMLPKAARYDVILEQRKDGKLGEKLTEAMEAIEERFPPLAGQLPKDYSRFEDELLESMMRRFDTEALRTASGDVFGRIYEYFLAEFSKQGAHDNGEFFTPPSIVQTIVHVIEPDHGIILDPACGSGGMFVQSSHFIEDAGQDTMKRVTFYGHEKNETTAKIEFAAHARLSVFHAAIADHTEAGGLRTLAGWVVKRCRPRRNSKVQLHHTVPPIASGRNCADSNITAALDCA
jgi:type I restriction enzyme M protein